MRHSWQQCPQPARVVTQRKGTLGHVQSMASYSLTGHDGDPETKGLAAQCEGAWAPSLSCRGYWATAGKCHTQIGVPSCGVRLGDTQQQPWEENGGSQSWDLGTTGCRLPWLMRFETRRKFTFGV